MELLIDILIAGLAVSYATELVSAILGRIINPKIIRIIITAPLSYYAMWLLGSTGNSLLVVGASVSFISLATLQIVNRPVTITTSNRR
jgi:hypothetical protein